MKFSLQGSFYFVKENLYNKQEISVLYVYPKTSLLSLTKKPYKKNPTKPKPDYKMMTSKEILLL